MYDVLFFNETVKIYLFRVSKLVQHTYYYLTLSKWINYKLCFSFRESVESVNFKQAFPEIKIA